ncbi:MAG: tannase/feruloyl esterase family alpha/beta hydrolase [Acidobacteria bacterium]|nr:tannase/feruloyl esterase family alpha/beta hydrolase [Acidobacteriota bacterium]
MSFRMRLSGLLFVTLATAAAPQHLTAQSSPTAESACLALQDMSRLTILRAEIKKASGDTPEYCYVKGIILPNTVYHVQLPLPDRWNGRFLKLGDGGKDGDLDFANRRVAQGYAVANSNMAHDDGALPGASFGFHDRKAEIDFGYWSVHVTTNAAKTIVQQYYGKPPEYSYFEGCSTGGRQGLMEAQRFPDDFDGIVAGDPVNHYQALNAGHVWYLQRLFKDNYAGMLAFDTDKDGKFDSLRKLEILASLFQERCDARDGIKDGVIDDPLSCPINPDNDLKGLMCPGDVNADDCFTKAQLQVIKDFYRGPYDSKGVSILKGKAVGSELEWAGRYIPYPGNSFKPSQIGTSGDHINYLFYDEDPGIPPADSMDLDRLPDKKGKLPEYAWWEFNIDDFTAGKTDLMRSIMDATDPDLNRFLKKNKGKLILYHGWADPSPPPEETLDYYRAVADVTFAGNMKATRDRARLFLIPGMGHCGGGPGPNDWDKLAPLAEWVERGKAPDYIVATHKTNGAVDNERRVCAYPQRAVYVGPPEGKSNPANWKESNFTCRGDF